MSDRFANVLAEWYRNAGKTGDAAYEEVEKEMKDMFEELRGRIDNEIDHTGVAKACAQVKMNYGGRGPHNQEKKICKTLVKTIYWMNGLDKDGTPKVDHGKPGERELREHLRCIVGYSAMAKILSNKCEVVDIIENVQETVGDVIGIGAKGNINEKCNSVTYGDLALGSQILQKNLGEWVHKGNSAKNWLSTYLNWELCPKNGKWKHENIDEGQDKNKGVMDLFKEKKGADLYKKIDPPVGSTSQENKLQEVLHHAKSCGTESGEMENCLKKKMELIVGK
ncbi:SICAvar, type I (fragment) [Plasmodium knowlesi strain H]|uniref:SICAvar, type I n=1 Tax=Plasmodium knowlesi (strain H) TaxID=5851 RepID=A0A193QTY8_PLAKH